MVICYVMPRLSWWLTRRKMLQPWVGLPNILSGRFVVPERLQDDAQPESLVNDLLPLIDNELRREAILNTFADLHHRLLADTAQRVAGVLNHLADTGPRG
jgi:lipid-A-disaccharide synthase